MTPSFFVPRAIILNTFIGLALSLTACQHIQIAGNPIPVKSELKQYAADP